MRPVLPAVPSALRRSRRGQETARPHSTEVSLSSSSSGSKLAADRERDDSSARSCSRARAITWACSGDQRATSPSALAHRGGFTNGAHFCTWLGAPECHWTSVVSVCNCQAIESDWPRPSASSRPSLIAATSTSVARPEISASFAFRAMATAKRAIGRSGTSGSKSGCKKAPHPCQSEEASLARTNCSAAAAQNDSSATGQSEAGLGHCRVVSQCAAWYATVRNSHSSGNWSGIGGVRPIRRSTVLAVCARIGVAST